MVSEFVTKAKMKVTLMFKSQWKFGQIPYAVFVKIMGCQILPCVLYGADILGLRLSECMFFCIKKVFKRCQPNSKHEGMW